jgi:hypothetical protein
MTLSKNEPEEIHRARGLLTETEYARLTDARQVAQRELDERGTRAWRIFSWSSCFLLAATLGIIVLFSRPGVRFPMWPYGFLVMVGLGFFSACAALWIDQNQMLARKVRKLIRDHDRKLGVQTDYEAAEIVTGYAKFILLLTAAAILAVVVTVDY